VPLPGETQPPPTGRPDLQELLNRAWIDRLHPAFFALRRAFGAVDVPVLAAPQQGTVAAILERMQRLRTGARR
jgi:hypothetical protein